MFIAALEAELARVLKAEHALAVRRAHLTAALLRARQGESEGVIRAQLEAKSIIVLVPPVAAGSRT